MTVAEAIMNEMEQTLTKFVGHHVEGALRFRNGVAVGTEAPDFELPSWMAVCFAYLTIGTIPTWCWFSEV